MVSAPGKRQERTARTNSKNETRVADIKRVLGLDNERFFFTSMLYSRSSGKFVPKIAQMLVRTELVNAIAQQNEPASMKNETLH